MNSASWSRSGVTVMKRMFLAAACLLALLISGCRNANNTVALPEKTSWPVSKTKPPVIAESVQIPNDTPAFVPEPAAQRITLLAVGDLLCLGGQLISAKTGDTYDFGICFDEVRDIISEADVAIANLETLIAEGYPYTAVKSGQSDFSPNPSDYPSDNTLPDPSPDPANPNEGNLFEGSGGSSGFSGFEGFENFTGFASSKTAGVRLLSSNNPRINGPESFLAAVYGAGFDILTTANNHMYDYEADGLIKTLEMIDRYGFLHTGAYTSYQIRKPLVANVYGINIGIAAYTDILNNKPGSNESYMIDRYHEPSIQSDIQAARAAGADFVIVSVHWGKEHTHKPTKKQRQMAEFIAEAGADLILGAHPHCLQPVEIIETGNRSVPVFYSLGNFLSSMPEWMHKDGVMVRIVLEKDPETESVSIAELRYLPTLCIRTETGNYQVLPCLSASQQGPYAAELERSRVRTAKIFGCAVVSSD